MKIRQTKLGDKKEFMKLVKGLYNKSCPEIVKKWENSFNKMFKSAIVAEEKNEIAGYIAFGVRKNSLYIGDLYVIPKFRRKRIATKLINFIDSIKRNLNKKYLLLDVKKKNYNARKFYKKIGFEILGENKLKKHLIRLRR